jgi:hypothetical protein
MVKTKAMKDYSVTILTRETILIKDQLWKAESIQDAEKKVSDFLFDKEFRDRPGKNNSLQKKEEFIGKNNLWMHLISRSGETSGEVFFVKIEEGSTLHGAMAGGARDPA